MPKTPDEIAAEKEAIEKTIDAERSSASVDAGHTGGRGAPPSHLPEDLGRRERRDKPEGEPT
jgi:hypothetical protein